MKRAKIEKGPPKPPPFRRVFEDTHVIVVDKPPGLLTQPGPERERGTLLSQIHRYLHRKAEGHRFHLRVVHRLDRDTSGLLVFSKSSFAQRGLLWQFKHRQVEKKYLAVVEGILPQNEGTFRTKLVRNRGDWRRGSTHRRNAGKVAVTHYRVRERLRGATLLEVGLETGRTHQIRIHFAEAGFPLIGEPVYRNDRNEPKIPFHRQALHAQSLAFTHPHSGERLQFTADMPDDLQQLLARLRDPAARKAGIGQAEIPESRKKNPLGKPQKERFVKRSG